METERAEHRGGTAHHRWHRVRTEKTTVYLPHHLKAAVTRAPAQQGLSEAEVIRPSISYVLGG